VSNFHPSSVCVIVIQKITQYFLTFANPIFISWYVFDSMAVGQLTTRMRESVKRLSIIKKPSVSFLSFRSSVKEEEEGGADEENGSIP
jgi:hypothetical protein